MWKKRRKKIKIDKEKACFVLIFYFFRLFFVFFFFVFFSSFFIHAKGKTKAIFASKLVRRFSYCNATTRINDNISGDS